MKVSKFRLVDAETGMIIRHYVRTMQAADREREWYERHTGRTVRIIKLFESDADGDDTGEAPG
jgi:hypothetical protein